MAQRIPERIIERAVQGMLPKGSLGRDIRLHLKVGPGIMRMGSYSATPWTCTFDHMHGVILATPWTYFLSLMNQYTGICLHVMVDQGGGCECVGSASRLHLEPADLRSSRL